MWKELQVWTLEKIGYEAIHYDADNGGWFKFIKKEFTRNFPESIKNSLS